MPDAPRVRRLFSAIARRYDLTNDVLSLGVHRLWRRRLARLVVAGRGGVPRAGADRPLVLDVCTGTGDLAVALQRRGAATVGVDFCPEMVRLAAAKTGATAASAFVVGDALRLPFAAGTFEAATVAFGIRNVADPLGGVREMARVCRPGGRVVVLEFCRPRVPGFAPLYGFYFKTVLPRIGAAVSGDREGAYRYLQQTVAGFPERDEFLDIMRAAGLVQLRYEVVSLGIACIYHGSTPARVARRPPAASGRVEAEVS